MSLKKKLTTGFLSLISILAIGYCWLIIFALQLQIKEVARQEAQEYIDKHYPGGQIINHTLRPQLQYDPSSGMFTLLAIFQAQDQQGTMHAHQQECYRFHRSHYALI